MNQLLENEEYQIHLKCRSDAQRASKQKEMKEKELELCAFNAEHIEDSGHTQSLVRFKRFDQHRNCECCPVSLFIVGPLDANAKVCSKCEKG